MHADCTKPRQLFSKKCKSTAVEQTYQIYRYQVRMWLRTDRLQLYPRYRSSNELQLHQPGHLHRKYIIQEAIHQILPADLLQLPIMIAPNAIGYITWCCDGYQTCQGSVQTHRYIWFTIINPGKDHTDYGCDLPERLVVVRKIEPKLLYRCCSCAVESIPAKPQDKYTKCIRLPGCVPEMH